jgi:hypothetical protein
MTDVKMKGSRKHEEDFAELIGGTRVRGSGSQWHAKADAANQHFTPFAFRGDCKCTQGQSISVSKAMIKKLLEDAGGERPALPLRFYANERLDVTYDLVAILADDFGELLENAREAAELKARIAEAMIVNVPEHMTDDQVAEFHRQLTEIMASGELPAWADPAEADRVPDETFTAMSAALIAAQDRAAELEGQVTGHRERADELARQLREAAIETQRRRGDDEAVERISAAVVHDPGTAERLQAELAKRDEQLAQADEENRLLRATLDAMGEEPAAPQPETPAPGLIPQLPWTVVQEIKLPGGRVRHTGDYWDAAGGRRPMMVTEIRLEPVGPHTERLMVNNRLIRAGDLYIDGQLRLRVGAR